jgi:hypothetical protein
MSAPSRSPTVVATSCSPLAPSAPVYPPDNAVAIIDAANA